jgi:hypothetical protein
LTPADDVLQPEEIVLRLLPVFGTVCASRHEADESNASFVGKVQDLVKAGAAEAHTLREVEAERAPGSSLLVRMWDGADPSPFVQCLASARLPLDLVSSKAVPARNHRATAARIAKALAYQVERIDTD